MFDEDKKINRKRGIVIVIVQCENDFGNTPNENIYEQPFVVGNGETGLYYLANGVSAELEYFINTGKRPEKDVGTDKEYHVFPQEQEAQMVNRWTELGMTVAYRRQQIELACRITIVYMQVKNPGTGLSVSVIPWFVAAGRPYPIFAYAYAIGHYQRAEKKSLEESAAAVRKLFGISGFHKSTVSRSLNAKDGLIDDSRHSQPLEAEALKGPGFLYDIPAAPHQSHESITGQVSRLLTAYPSVKALKRDIGEKLKRLPDPIRRAGGISYALGAVPDKRFEIIVHSGPGNKKPGGHRKRPPRARNKGPKPVQRPLKFVDYPQREENRKAFIAICRRAAIGAAIMRHRFLI